MKINEIRPLEQDYLKGLKALALIPKMLYFYGKIPESRLKSVAIVGSRKNTPYGKEVAYRAAYEAAKAGAVVVSGLAYGIDSIAHRGALDAGGITIAVLGTPIDQIYPSVHKGLAREIIERGGAVISEYPAGAVPESGTEMRARFLARNRIIAGLSDVVLIAEAAAKSGSLNTAMHALDTGKDLLAVPADITRVNSAGCNKLISQGATPYTEPEDLLRLLFPERTVKTRIGSKNHLRRQLSLFAETPVEAKVLSQILAGIRDGDEIIALSSISASEFSQAITMLEIKGAVKSLGANRWGV